MFICSSIITEASQVVVCTSQPSKTFDCTVSTILHKQGVGTSFKIQEVVNENSGGGQILTVYQGKAEAFLEMKSISEIVSYFDILYFYYEEEVFLFTSDFQKQKTKKNQKQTKKQKSIKARKKKENKYNEVYVCKVDYLPVFSRSTETSPIYNYKRVL